MPFQGPVAASRVGYINDKYVINPSKEQKAILAVKKDIIVTSNENFAIGKKKSDHDLSQLKEPLRTHGGLGETDIPIFISKKIDDSYKSKGVLKNYDIFDLALNYG